MASDHMIRASDRDRDAVAATLREAYAAGRLTLTELTERIEQGFASRTWGELRALTRDLPEQPHLGADLPNPTPPPRPLPHPRTTGSRDAGPRNTGPQDTDPRNTLPANTGSGPRPERPQGWSTPVVPFALVWLLIVIITRSGASVAVPVVVLALVLLFTSLSRRK